MSQLWEKSLEDCHLDHIAVAVDDLEKAAQVYRDMGLSFSDEKEVVSSQGVRVLFGAIGERAKIELLEPWGEEGPIHKFLAKRGPGIHHLCFAVTDVQKKSEELKNLGHQLLYPQAVPGANNCLINFIHPRSTGGVLIELSQAMK